VSELDLTREEVVARIAASGARPITARTWSSYVTRGYAPKAARRIGRTPLWTTQQVDDWLSNRPGQGARKAKGTWRTWNAVGDVLSGAGVPSVAEDLAGVDDPPTDPFDRHADRGHDD